MPQKEHWRILHLEDDELDRELVRQRLKAEGVSADFRYAATRPEFDRALAGGDFDLILSDFTLPGYGGNEALAQARQACPNTPFIFVSGTIGEEQAIDCMKNGATDYLLKDNPWRLIAAIRRALHEAEEQRKREAAELALRESEKRHRLLFEHNSQPMWMFDVETLRFLAVNDAAVSHYGWSREEFLAMTILDIRPPEDEPLVRDELAAPPMAFRSGKTWRHQKKDGTAIDVEISAHGLLFGDREARLVMVNDVTAHKHAVEALEGERALMRTLIDQIPDLIYVKDIRSRFLLANEAIARLMGARGAAELLGRTDADFHAPALAATFRAEEEQVLAGVPLINEEQSAIHPDGSRRVFLTTKLPLRDHRGKISALVGIGRDITERTAAEDARRRSEERFAAIFESSPVGIGYSTSESRMIDVNRQLCEILGYTRDELIGRTVGELNLWAQPEERDAALRRLQAEKRLRNHEARIRTKSGELRTVLLSVETLQLGAEPVLLAMLADITDRKVLEGELLRANRVQSVGRLASGIAHDMNNILAPIMMAAPLLRMKLGPEETEKTLATVELSAKRGADLVRQLLMFGRGVEGGRGPVEIVAVIKEVMNIAQGTFPKNIALRSSVPADSWAIRGDASQLHQVLLNLIVNARDAMPRGGTLTIEAKNVRLDENFAASHPEIKPGAYVRLSVADTGTGIPAQIADKIFDPFFTTKAVGQGTGLGLSTVLGIVKSHDGLVTLQSEENVETKFEVYLPALLAEREPESARPAGAPPRGNNELVLVVDDEETIRTVLRKTLMQYNYRVLVAADGAEAAAVFARNMSEIKLVVTDLDMPFMSGASLVRTLLRIKPEIKILVSSGVGAGKNARDQTVGLEAIGLPPILFKPYSAETLLTAVHQVLANGALHHDESTPASRP